MSRYSYRGLLLGLLVISSACGTATAPGAVSSDVSEARRRWLAFAPTDYTFLSRTTTSWVPLGGRFQFVTVRGGWVVSSVDFITGAPRDTRGQFTLSGLWTLIDHGGDEHRQLAEVLFDERGVPVRLMNGTFANDGGMLYEVLDVRER
jgi:hypothetical protein